MILWCQQLGECEDWSHKFREAVGAGAIYLYIPPGYSPPMLQNYTSWDPSTGFDTWRLCAKKCPRSSGRRPLKTTSGEETNSSTFRWLDGIRNVVRDGSWSLHWNFLLESTGKRSQAYCQLKIVARWLGWLGCRCCSKFYLGKGVMDPLRTSSNPESQAGIVLSCLDEETHQAARFCKNCGLFARGRSYSDIYIYSDVSWYNDVYSDT